MNLGLPSRTPPVAGPQKLCLICRAPCTCTERLEGWSVPFLGTTSSKVGLSGEASGACAPRRASSTGPTPRRPAACGRGAPRPARPRRGRCASPADQPPWPCSGAPATRWRRRAGRPSAAPLATARIRLQPITPSNRGRPSAATALAARGPLRKPQHQRDHAGVDTIDLPIGFLSLIAPHQQPAGVAGNRSCPLPNGRVPRPGRCAADPRDARVPTPHLGGGHTFGQRRLDLLYGAKTPSLVLKR
jgi:hypothetical protein